VRGALPALVLLVLLAHGVGLRNGFVYDDHRFVDSNPRLATASWAELLLDPATHTADSDRDVWRPLRALSHRFDLSRGLGPFGFHLHSLLLHLAVVAAGWWLLRLWLPAPADAPALLGAVLLAVHPLGVEVVGWVSSRGDQYALLFGLLALVSALRAADASRLARPAWLGAAGVLALLAFLGKESAGWVPLVAALGWRRLGRPRAATVVSLAAGSLAGLVLRQFAMHGLSPTQTLPHGGGALPQAGWALYGTGLTLAHVAWPARLSVDYVQSAWLAGPPVWLRPFSLLAAVAIALAFGCRRRAPVATLLLGWALLAWLPSSSLLVTLRSLVNDRGAYPLLLPLGALAGLPLAGRPRAAALAGLALAVALLPMTMRRTQDFHDDASLWSATLRAQPASVLAHLGLAQQAARSDRGRQGDLLQRAVELAAPGSRQEALALAARGDWLLRVARRPEDAVHPLQRALRQLRAGRERPWPLPEEAPTVASLAEALLLVGRPAESDALLVSALAEQPGSLALQLQRAGLALHRFEHDGDHAALHVAGAALRAATALDPDHPVVEALGRRLQGHVQDAGPAGDPPPPP
jgi:hypothetical protein